MIYMEVRTEDRKTFSSQYWCGQSTTLVSSPAATLDIVHAMVEASGDELEAIRRYVNGVRMVPGRVVQWVGEDALFIIINLDLTKISGADMKRAR